MNSGPITRWRLETAAPRRDHFKLFTMIWNLTSAASREKAKQASDWPGMNQRQDTICLWQHLLENHSIGVDTRVPEAMAEAPNYFYTTIRQRSA